VLQVKHVCQVAEEMQRMGKCVVIGLQSTGEARTLEAVEVGTRHKVHIYIEYYSVHPLVGIGSPPTPLPQTSEPFPPPYHRVGGHTRLRLKGWVSPNSDDWIKS